MEPKRVLFAVAVLTSLSGCRRDRSQQEVDVDVQAQSSGGEVAFVVGQAQGPQAPDYVSQQMQFRYQQFASDMLPSSPVFHGVLAEGQEQRFQTVLETGRCYRIIGVGGPAMRDLDLWIEDENGNQIARDTAVDNFPVLGLGNAPICPRWTGTFHVRALAYGGYGEYGVQVFRSP